MSHSNLLQLSSFSWVSTAAYHLVAFRDELPSPLQRRPSTEGCTLRYTVKTLVEVEAEPAS